MSRAISSIVLWAALGVVLLVAGLQTVLYMLDWEWARAQFAAVAFVAALLLATARLILARMRRMEARIEVLTAALLAQEGGQATPGATPGPHPDGAEPRPDFRWLATPTATVPVLTLPLLATLPAWPDRSVFIPVFLATGLVVTVAASAVERLSALRAGAAAGTPKPPPPPVTSAGGTPWRRAREAVNGMSTRTLVLTPIVVLLLGGVAAAGLYWAVHDWSKPIGAGVTTLTVDVARKGGPDLNAVQSTEVVGRYCSVNAGVLDLRYQGVGTGPEGTALLHVTPLLDADASLRFIGCLEDAVLEGHEFEVTATKLTPVKEG